MHPHPEIQRRFKNHSAAIRQLLADQSANTHKAEQNPETDLRLLFRRLQDLLETKQIWNFHTYLQQGKFAPLDYNPCQLTFDQLSQLFQLWIHCEYSNESMAESVFIEDSETGGRNQELTDILHTKSHIINNFVQSTHKKKKLMESEMLELLERLLAQYYIYEFNRDQVDFTLKQTFRTTLKDILKRYQDTERKNKPIGEPELFLVDQIPDIFRFWEKVNPQLVVENRKRKIMVSNGVQTDRMDRTGKFVKKTSIGSNYNKQSSRITVQSTITNAIEELNCHLMSAKDQDWVESINFLIITLKKQRKRLYPKFKLDPILKSNTQQLKQVEKKNRETRKELILNLGLIYDNFKENKAKIQEAGISILGDYAEDAFNENKEVFTTEDFQRFMREVSKFANLEDKEISGNFLFRSTKILTKTQFIEEVEQFLSSSQSNLSPQIINRFVGQIIKPESPDHEHLHQKIEPGLTMVPQSVKCTSFRKKKFLSQSKKKPISSKIQLKNNKSLSPTRKLSHPSYEISLPTNKNTNLHNSKGSFTARNDFYETYLGHNLLDLEKYLSKPRRKHRAFP